MPCVWCCFQKLAKKDHDSEDGEESREADSASGGPGGYAPWIAKHGKDVKAKSSDDEFSVSSSDSSVGSNDFFVPLM